MRCADHPYTDFSLRFRRRAFCAAKLSEQSQMNMQGKAIHKPVNQMLAKRFNGDAALPINGHGPFRKPALRRGYIKHMADQHGALVPCRAVNGVAFRHGSK